MDVGAGRRIERCAVRIHHQSQAGCAVAPTGKLSRLRDDYRLRGLPLVGVAALCRPVGVNSACTTLVCKRVDSAAKGLDLTCRYLIW